MAADYRTTILRDIKGDIELRPGVQVLDDEGRDWAWAYVLFADISGHPGYKIGTDGTLWTAKGQGCRSKCLNNRPYSLLGVRTKKFGHKHAMLYNCSKHTHFSVHRLVLETFIGPCPDGMETCHNNGNAADNRLVNLRWGTHSDNCEDQLRHGTRLMGSASPSAKFTDKEVVKVCEMLQAGIDYREISKQLQINRRHLYHIRARSTWCHISENYRFPMPDKKHRPKGTKAHNAKLDENLVRHIRKLAKEGISQSAIGRRLDLHRLLVARVVRGLGYTDVK